MLLQLRVTVPPDRTPEVLALFEESPGTAHLAVLDGASVAPAGDLVLADVARESADGLVDALKDLGIDRDGGIAMVGRTAHGTPAPATDARLTHTPAPRPAQGRRTIHG